MRVTVDANVLISSTFWCGSSDKIMERVESKEIELILSKEIIKEFMEVLEYEEIQQKIKNKNLDMKRTVEKIVSISTIVEPKQKLDVVKEDAKDNKIIECAFEGNAEYVVSQDNHLLKLDKFGEIKILTPEEFLKIVESS